MSPDAQALAPGEEVGPYRLVSLLGSGGFATVWRADGPDGSVALKFLDAHAAREAANVRRFEVEADTLRRLKHPSIARCLGFLEHRGMPAIAMDYIEGVTLRRDMLNRSEPGEYFAWAEISEIFSEILGALEVAHRSGVVHRDLKPANIVRRTAPEPTQSKIVLLDFGVAKLTGSDRVDETTIGRPIGTLPYMAPEQHRSEGIGPATDLFAAGVLLFELATLRRPWMRDGMGQLARFHDNLAAQSDLNNYPAILFRTTKEVRPSAVQYRLDTPAGVVALIESALSPTIEKRPASAEDFRRQLDSALEQLRSAGALEAPRAPDVLFDRSAMARTVPKEFFVDRAMLGEGQGTPATPLAGLPAAEMSLVVPSELSDPEPSEPAPPIRPEPPPPPAAPRRTARAPRGAEQVEARLGAERSAAVLRNRSTALGVTAIGGLAAAALGLVANAPATTVLVGAGAGCAMGYLAATARRWTSRRAEFERFREALSTSRMFRWNGEVRRGPQEFELEGSERRYAKTSDSVHLSLNLRAEDPTRVAGAPIRVTIQKPARADIRSLMSRWEQVTGIELSPGPDGSVACPIRPMLEQLRADILQIAEEDLKLLVRDTLAAYAHEIVFTASGLRLVIHLRGGVSPEHQVLSVYRACSLFSSLYWWGETVAGLEPARRA